MAKGPRLEGERLVLVPFGDEHLSQNYVNWLNDQNVVRFSENRHQRHDMSTCTAYVRSFDDSPHFLWAILKRSPETHIGNVVAYIDVPNRLANIGILIGEQDAWGKGLGCEAWRLAQDFLLSRGGIRKVEAGAMAENAAMLSIFRACGMQEEGRRPRHFLLDGREVDLVQFGIFAE